MRLGPVILFTSAFDESVPFYAAVLGVEPVRNGPGFAEFPLGAGTFALHRTQEPVLANSLHLHFTVDDLDAVLSRAARAGIRPTEGPTVEPWGREASFRDPAGFPFEVTQPPSPSA
jgi:catechol 2,3-dioxygenase-like lactoylglutathione lyase family enzyme